MAAQRSKQLVLGQRNVGHCLSAVDAINANLKDYDVVVVQEPYYLSSGQIGGWPLRETAVAALEPRAAILIPNSKLQFLVVSISRDLVAVEIDTVASSVFVISAYMSPNVGMLSAVTALDALLHALPTDASVVLLGVFNARSQLWGDWCTTNRGKTLEELIVSNGLMILNDPESGPTFHAQRGSSWIDVALGSFQAPTAFSQWSIERDTESATQHVRIRVVLDTVEGDASKVERVNWGRMKWRALRASLRRTLDSNPGQRTLNEEVIFLTEEIRKACQNSKRKEPERFRPVPWWTPQLTRKRKQWVAARRRWQRCTWSVVLRKDFELRFRKARAEYKRLLRSSKRSHWAKVLIRETLSGSKG